MRIRNYEDILAAAQNRKSINYYNIAKLTKYCFTGDVREANHYINKIESANTAHGVSFFFKWAFRIMYRSKFNPKKLIIRPTEISKKTTRLTLDQIEIVRKKYKEWIDDRTNLGKNMINFVVKNRTKYYYAFEALLCSGMRIGELCAIDFVHMKDYRVFESAINKNEKYVEIVINSEKNCKQREIYLPYYIFEYFQSNQIRLKANLIKDNFITFRKWASIPFRLTAHVLRRTKASLMHECGADINTIALVLGNNPKTVSNHYVITSGLSFDAWEIGCAYANGKIIKKENLFMDHTKFESKL